VISKETRPDPPAASEELFDQHPIRAKARPGDIAADNTDPVFLTWPQQAPESIDGPVMCDGLDKVGEFSRAVGASTVTTIEVARS
jgi:hypothetical protein